MMLLNQLLILNLEKLAIVNIVNSIVELDCEIDDDTDLVKMIKSI